jgi:lipoprotein-anchoring transpeptidase ErfK/SrfK
MRLIFLPVALFVVLVSFLFVRVHLKTPNTQNLIEKAVAKEHDGTDTFLEQVKVSRGEWIENAGTPIFDNQYLATLPPRLADSDSTVVLGSHTATDGAEKWIDVSLSEQKLRAYEGSRLIYEFPISSGRPGYDTVKGEFSVWRKVRNQTYRGGSRERGDYYYLPNVPYSLFFYQGYAIHGAYWHNDFGIKRRSSGCINLKIPDAEQVYNWAGPAIIANAGALNSTPDNPGVRVVVHD